MILLLIAIGWLCLIAFPVILCLAAAGSERRDARPARQPEADNVIRLSLGVRTSESPVLRERRDAVGL